MKLGIVSSLSEQEREKMSRICKNCGAELRDGAQFCPECGSKIEKVDVPKKGRKNIWKKVILFIVAIALLFGIGFGAMYLISGKLTSNNKNNTKKSVTTSKKKDTKKKEDSKSNSKEIADQCFETELAGVGTISFKSYTANTNENLYADARFVIEKDGKVYEELPGMTENNINDDSRKQFESVKAVSFFDYNEDNLDDIVIINSYKTDQDTVEDEVRIYPQNEDYKFALDKEISDEVNSNVDDKIISNVQEYFEEKNKPSDEWKQVYIEWMGKWLDGYTFVLFDLNGDKIPEIAAIGLSMADGTTVGTYNNGVVQEAQVYRMDAVYLPGQNLLDNVGGSMDSYYDRVFQIQDGTWVQIADGKYGAKYSNAGMELDENGNLIYEYKWNGQVVSEEEYQEELSSVIDVDSATHLETNGLSYDEMVSEITSY